MELLAERYELGDPLGHGRSTVYRATDTRLRRQVAIKRVELLAGQEDAEAVRVRALREAQASARLNNPAAVGVYDVVEETGAIWLVMELVDGPSLAELVADSGPLPHARAARLGLQVLTALEAAHLAGVVHRDVKPANVLVVEGDRAKLTDFGVATIRDESRVTMTGLIVGSPSYMAPEQATGADITPATDLWALGALLYFAVEGEPPFLAGSAIATASAVVHGEPRGHERPGPLVPIIGRLLTKDPAQRPTAGAVRATLSRVGAARPSSPGRPSVPPVPAPPVSSAPPVSEPDAESEPTVSDSVSESTVSAPAVLPAPTVSAPPVSAPPVSEPTASDELDAVSEPVVSEPDAVSAPTAVQPGPVPAPPDVSPSSVGPARPEGSAAVGVGRAGGRRTGPAPRVPIGAAAVLVVVVALVAVVLALRGGDDGGEDGESAGGDAPAATTETTQAPGSSTAPSSTALTTTTVAPGSLPAGWSPYTDPSGRYTIGHPPGWQVQPVAANRTDFRDPATGTFVRVEWTDTPGADAAGAWREAEPGFRSRNANYEGLGISPVTYRDYPAALWEFRHGTGETLHTGNLGFIAAGRGYALMLRTPESQWAASQPLFEQFKQAFQPA